MRVYWQVVGSALAVVTVVGLSAAASGLFAADAPGWFTDTSVERANEQPVLDNRPQPDRPVSPQLSAGPGRLTDRPATPETSGPSWKPTPTPSAAGHGEATTTPQADSHGRASPTPGGEHSARATPAPTPAAGDDHGSGQAGTTGGSGSGSGSGSVSERPGGAPGSGNGGETVGSDSGGGSKGSG